VGTTGLAYHSSCVSGMICWEPSPNRNILHDDGLTGIENKAFVFFTHDTGPDRLPTCLLLFFFTGLALHVRVCM